MRLVAGIVFYAASSKLEIDCDCQSTEKRSILWNAPSSVTLHATLHPLKRSILCNAPCSETPNQRMRRFRGFGVSRLIGISRSICKSAFHGRSANQMMRQFAWSGISREIGKWQDAANPRHCRASRKCFSHIVNFSKFLSVRNYNDPKYLIGQNPSF